MKFIHVDHVKLRLKDVHLKKGVSFGKVTFVLDRDYNKNASDKLIEIHDNYCDFLPDKSFCKFLRFGKGVEYRKLYFTCKLDRSINVNDINGKWYADVVFGNLWINDEDEIYGIICKVKSLKNKIRKEEYHDYVLK